MHVNVELVFGVVVKQVKLYITHILTQLRAICQRNVAIIATAGVIVAIQPPPMIVMVRPL
jgi:hypothetical protein